MKKHFLSSDESWTQVRPGLYQRNFFHGISGQIEYITNGINAQIQDELGNILEKEFFYTPEEAKDWIRITAQAKIEAIKAQNPFSGGFETSDDFTPGEDVISTVNPNFDDSDDEFDNNLNNESKNEPNNEIEQRKAKNPVQSIAFNKNIWSIRDARIWLKENGYIYDGFIDKTKNEYRFRQIDPEKFKRWAVKSIKNEGINLILGFYND